MYTIEKVSAMKSFYYLMAIDGDILENELDKFNEIGVEIIGDTFIDLRDQIIEECKKQIDSAVLDDDLYDVIQEGLDETLSVNAEKENAGIWPRHLLWNMLTIAYSDGGCSKDENRFISHMARILQVEKSVFLEMKQMMITAIAIQNEIEQLHISEKPYAEVRPLVDEMENRKQTIVEAVKELIEDDVVFVSLEKEEKKKFDLLETSKKISDSVSPVVKELGEKTQKTYKEASGFMMDKTAQGVSGLKEGTGKIFSKIKATTKKQSDKGGVTNLPEKEKFL